jgi:hypothetical protein
MYIRVETIPESNPRIMRHEAELQELKMLGGEREREKRGPGLPFYLFSWASWAYGRHF